MDQKQKKDQNYTKLISKAIIVVLFFLYILFTMKELF